MPKFMLSNLNKKFHIWMLDSLLKRDCGDGSVTGGYKCNCFWVYLYKNKKDFFEKKSFGVIRTCLDGYYYGIQFSSDDRSKNRDFRFSFEELSKFVIAPKNHYRAHEIDFDSVYEMASKLHLYRVCICFSILKYEFSQFIFNKRSLRSKNRYDFLKLIVDNYTASSSGFSYVDVLGKLHGMMIYSHPNYNEEAKKISALLDGFVYTNELRFDSGKYYLTGLAFKAIDDYEEQDRRHKSLSWTQWILIAVTFGLIITGLIQADVIVVPKIWDFSR